MNKKLLRIIITAALLLGAWMVERFAALPMWQLLLIYLVPYILISYEVLGEACEGILKGDPLDEDFLMSVATIGALAIGFFPWCASLCRIILRRCDSYRARFRMSERRTRCHSSRSRVRLTRRFLR